MYRIAVICLLFFSGQLLAQKIDSTHVTHKGVLKSNPLTPFWGTIPLTSELRLAYEIPISYNQSVQVAASYLGKSPFVSLIQDSINNGNTHIKTYGGRFQYTHRFYLKNHKNATHIPTGVYIGPHISFARATFTTRYANQYDVYIQGTQFNVVAMMGFQYYNNSFILGKVVTDLFVGLGYKNNYWIEKQAGQQQPHQLQISDFSSFYAGPVKIYAGFNLGFPF